jgi:hypothetical protein
MDYYKLGEIAEKEFADIVFKVQVVSGKLRLYITDGSYFDIWFSKKIKDRFAYHWERRQINGQVYRFDNHPHEEYKNMKNYPRHFHDGSERNVKESWFSKGHTQVLREFLSLIRDKLNDELIGEDN